MKKIFVTTEFCKGAKDLVNKNKHDVLNDLRTVLIKLANDWPIPGKYHDHQLQGSDFRELHLSGDDLLLYRYEPDSNTLVVSLKLANITNHKEMKHHDASRKDYQYSEVSTTDLHDITSSTIPLTSYDQNSLYDFLESLSDYASMNMEFGYVLLDSYTIDNNIISSSYDYYLYDTDDPTDSVDFIIDLDELNICYIDDLNAYLNLFSDKLKTAFE